MPLTVEDGSGITGADAYCARAVVDTYWSNRPHDPLAATWAAESDTSRQDGAIREASAFIDAEFGLFYRGSKLSGAQGLLFPRADAEDERGYPITGVPGELIKATCELAGRALTSRLREDVDRTGYIKSVSTKLGPMAESYTYGGEGSAAKKSYGFVVGILAPILSGAQPDAPARWEWA